MTQRRSITAGQNRRHPAPMLAEAFVPPRVYAAVDAGEQPSRDAILERLPPHPETRQLLPRHDAMLSRRESRGARVWGRVDFCTHVVH